MSTGDNGTKHIQSTRDIEGNCTAECLKGRRYEASTARHGVFWNTRENICAMRQIALRPDRIYPFAEGPLPRMIAFNMPQPNAANG